MTRSRSAGLVPGPQAETDIEEGGVTEKTVVATGAIALLLVRTAVRSFVAAPSPEPRPSPRRQVDRWRRWLRSGGGP